MATTSPRATSLPVRYQQHMARARWRAQQQQQQQRMRARARARARARVYVRARMYAAHRIAYGAAAAAADKVLLLRPFAGRIRCRQVARYRSVAAREANTSKLTLTSNGAVSPWAKPATARRAASPSSSPSRSNAFASATGNAASAAMTLRWRSLGSLRLECDPVSLGPRPVNRVRSWSGPPPSMCRAAWFVPHVRRDPTGRPVRSAERC